MSKPLVSDDLWVAMEPLLAPEPLKSRGSRPRCNNRAVLAGIIFVLRSGIPWEMLPRGMGYSGMACWHRLRDWQEVGVWAGLHRVRRERLADARQLSRSRAALDSASVASKREAETGPTPTIAANRARSGMLWSTAEVCRLHAEESFSPAAVACRLGTA